MAGLKSKKDGVKALIGTTAFLIFGVAAFVVGYGLIDGWEAVLAWFTSTWAITVYIAIGLWIIVALSIMMKMRGSDHE